MNLDPEKAFESIKERVSEAVKETFPIENRGRAIDVEEVWVDDNKKVEDINDQKKAKLEGKTWGAPLKARLVLKDIATNRTLQRKTLKLADIPKTTDRYGYIHKGNEYQVDNMWHLREGVYSRVRKDGTLASEFHVKGKPFNVVLNPENKKFSIKIGSSTPDLYPVLKAIGVSDNRLEKEWGKEVLEANKKSKDSSVDKLYKAYTGKKPKSRREAVEYILDRFKNQSLDPKVTEKNLGKPFKNISSDALLSSTQQLIGISKGDRKPDNRDSLLHKKLVSVDDHLAEAIKASKYSIDRKAQNTLGYADDIRRVIPRNLFQGPIDSAFTKKSTANIGPQVNPAEFISNQGKTTVLGEGGLGSEHMAMEEMKYVDPSHFGVLDPLQTPEGGRTGLTLYLTEGVQKDGDTVNVLLWDNKKKEMVRKKLHELRGKSVVIPDQVKLEDGKIKPLSKNVKTIDIEEGVKEDIPFSKTDYSFISPQQAASPLSNLIPFIANNNAVRGTTAVRQMEQAIPLTDREAPLVQVGSKIRTNEKKWGTRYSQRSPVNGKVKRITPSKIIVEDKDGAEHKVDLYDNFPLNQDQRFMHSTPNVKVGDKVKAHQTIADTNFTKDGVLSLGKNLDVGYMNYKGLNFEDGVVVSETGAKKLTSESLAHKNIRLNPEDRLSKKTFSSYYPKALTKETADKLDDDGVIKKGQLVKPNDVLIAALKKSTPTTESKMLSRLHKSMVRPFKNGSVTWDSDSPGIVTDVVKAKDGVKVFVRSEKPAEIGDKIVGRSGNKGIITKIMPDKEMPQVRGKPLDILLAPNTVPGRINLGQVLETAVSKVAEKTGKPYVVTNYNPESTIDMVKRDLKKHGLTDKEEVYDPASGRKMGDILAGKQYIFKLEHEVKKKSSARGGGPGYAYDMDRIPKGGGPKGAKALGNLGLYGLLASGAKANIREMHTWKTDMDQNDSVWTAIQSGLSLPAPKLTYAHKKFMNYLKGLGVDVKKTGNQLTLAPMTDKQVLGMSSGEIVDPGRMVMASDPTKPDKGGLFDKKTTGGIDGTKWSHITLAEPMPNPLFETSIMNLLDIKNKDYKEIITGKKKVDGQVGGMAIKTMLDRIDVDKELKKAKDALPKLSKNKLSDGYKRYRYLKALKEANLNASDAYMMKHVPVLPPSMRPLAATPDGRIARSDLNDMYKGVGLISRKLGELNEELGPEETTDLRSDLYSGLKALAGVGTFRQLPYRGIIDIIDGKRPDAFGGKSGQAKTGYFQNKLLGTKQDLTARSTITPNPKLGLDEVGIPEKAAMEMMKPFVVADVRKTTNVTPLKAQEMIKEDDPIAKASLQRVIKERPVLLKRDPVLHKYSIQGFKGKLVKGKNIEIHPLVTSGLNADFDGDTTTLFAPISQEAVKEAYKMMPSNNLFSSASNELMYVPNHEMQVGLYLMSRKGKKIGKSFKSLEEAEKALKADEITSTDIVKIGDKEITVGRARIANALPSEERKKFLASDEPFTKKKQRQLLTSVAKRDKDNYGKVANSLKDLGNDEVTRTAFSIGLSDFEPQKGIRKSVLSKTEAAYNKLPKSQKTSSNKIRMYDAATKAMLKLVDRKKSKNPDSTYLLQRSGVKPGPDQYRQLLLGPMLIKRPDGSIDPNPIKRSYSEGLDMGDYYRAATGARRGVIEKVQSVQEPGAITKYMMNSVLDEIVLDKDCDGDDGISLNIDEDDPENRVLARPVRIGKDKLEKGTPLTPELVSRLRSNKIKSVNVYSPLKCTHGPGVCPKCWGLDENGKLPQIGRNLGVESAHALGERSTQLALKAFHGGGVVSAGKADPDKKDLQDSFVRVKQLLTLPKELPISAPLSTTSGKVESLKKDAVGGYNVQIGGKKHYVPNNLGTPKIIGRGKAKSLRVGSEVKRGDALAEGPINPHHLLKYKGLRSAQRYISDELYKMYKGEGIDRRAAEMVTRSMTNTATVLDPGDIPGFVRGDNVHYNSVKSMNKTLPAGAKKMKVSPILKGVNTAPHEKSEDWLARLNHNRLESTIVDAAKEGWKSYLSGRNPIPAAIQGIGFGKGKYY